jgi:hypothetical protein
MHTCLIVNYQNIYDEVIGFVSTPGDKKIYKNNLGNCEYSVYCNSGFGNNVLSTDTQIFQAGSQIQNIVYNLYSHPGVVSSVTFTSNLSGLSKAYTTTAGGGGSLNNFITISGTIPSNTTPGIYSFTIDMTNNNPSQDVFTIATRHITRYFTVTAPLSTESFTPNSLSIYPNPTKDLLHFDLPNDISGKITDLTGKTLMTVNTKDIDVSSLSAGVYLLDITSEDKRYVTKIVKE